MTMLAICAFAATGLYGDAPDSKHAWAVHDWTRPKPVKVEPAPYVKTGAPSDAVVLCDGTRESFERNWCDAKGGRPGYVDNYADGQAGAIYAENPPMVNPQRRPGEWQVYDIIFHQPVWKGGALVHPGSVTVLFNGVLVQDAWEMEGLTTHCRRRPLAQVPTKGPLGLQDHGCLVQFRNIWYRPIPSRWDNLTHSAMSADPAAVTALRRETAARLFAAIGDKSEVSADNLLALGQVVQYAYEGEYKSAFDRCLEAYRAKKGDDAEVRRVNAGLGVLVRAGLLDESRLVK